MRNHVLLGPDASSSREGALYCRVAHRRSPDQLGVDQREAAGRLTAEEHGVRLAARRVFVDPLSTAWSREGLRPTWQALLAAVEHEGVGALVLFDAPELQRHHPWDFAQLLTLAERRGLRLLDPTGAWDLDDASVRRCLADRTERECRNREAAAARRRSRDAEIAGAGRPHGGGRRAYGYVAGTYDLIPFEASVVEQIFRWFIEGRSLTGIAAELNLLQAETAYGTSWSATGVARIVDAPRYAGLRVVRGQAARAADGSYAFGDWKPCVAVEIWEAARALRRAQAEHSATASRRRPESRYYPLTGLVQCARCGRGMVGSMVDGFATYACTGNNLVGADRCSRHVAADRLEELVDLRVVRRLERWDPDDAGRPGRPPTVAVLDEEAASRRAADQRQLARLRAMADPPAAEVARLVASIREVNRSVVIRAGDALEDLVTGRRASAGWRRISLARRSEVRRFLIARIRIGPVVGPRSVFDPGRVEIVPNAW
ncbi:recombinase family protein [Streptacidiphilus jiangxiensis]|uniref:recombinase family protein n=1 Tax=Streptacidiphilus jiangxiensis TaxID=235985 RepID=UPI001377A127|nr:recombinase family protein [Streptacidiphilus jiangxiensis]